MELVVNELKYTLEFVAKSYPYGQSWLKFETEFFPDDQMRFYEINHRRATFKPEGYLTLVDEMKKAKNSTEVLHIIKKKLSEDQQMLNTTRILNNINTIRRESMAGPDPGTCNFCTFQQDQTARAIEEIKRNHAQAYEELQSQINNQQQLIKNLTMEKDSCKKVLFKRFTI